jgi:hypothetical protein
MRGIMQYNIAPSKYKFSSRPFNKFIAKTPYSTNEVFITQYNGYDLTMIRCKSIYDGKLDYHSRLKIVKDNYELVNQHSRSGVETVLWFDQVSTKNPQQVEEKLKAKAMIIINQLDSNSNARLYLCNRGNIVEIDNLPQDVKEIYKLVV